MERFVRLLVAGGLALVAGLWIAARSGGSIRLLGGALAVAGTVAVLSGIAVELEARP